MDVRRRVLVSGRVQGVGYRVWCRDAAATYGVSGWVINRPDGRVEAVFEGPAPAVDRMVERCGHGPPHAQVTDLDVQSESVVGEVGFRLIR